MFQTSSAVAAAAQLLDWVREDASLVLGYRTSEQHILMLELRFLITFLKYTVPRYSRIGDKGSLLILIEDISQLGMHGFLPSPAKSWQPRQVNVVVGHALNKIKRVKSEIVEILAHVSRLSRRGSRLTDELVFDFSDSLLQDLEEVIGCMEERWIEDRLIRPSSVEGFKVLKTKLTSLRVMLSFTAPRCYDLDKLDQLFILVQHTADTAVYLLAYFFRINETNDYMASRLGIELSFLVQGIDPVKPEVREIYVGVLMASEPSPSTSSNTCRSDETLLDFVDILLDNTSKLLDLGTVPSVKDQIEILCDELTSLRYFLRDAERFAEPGILNDLLAHVEVMVIDVGALIYSLFDGEPGRATMSRLRLSELIRMFKDGNVLFTEIHVNILKAQISNLPRTDVLGDLDLILRDLKELLNDRVGSITTSLKDHIQRVERDMEFLGSFLTKIAKERYEHEKLDHIWRRIVRVMDEIEHLIDLVFIKDGHVSHHLLWISDLIKEMNFIKIEIDEIQTYDKNVGRQHEYSLTKFSGSTELSHTNGREIDGEMVGFKDEEDKLMEQLLWGSNHILSIVGMAGLGKTFLTRKVYNSPTIRDYFHVRAWCNVSQMHERKQLLISILSQVRSCTKETSKMTDEEIAGELKRSLLGQKYLIVLDDIWDIEAWNDLKRSFPDDKLGSKIVFTSRISNLALQARPDSQLHKLRMFSESESWELLQQKIFHKKSCPLELLEVGQQISRRCNGLPLTVVVVAGLLSREIEKEHWREVMQNLGSFIKADPKGQCMDILDLSYRSLPDHLKSCFLYFGSFPEDTEVPTTKLIQLWIAEGFIQKNEPNLEYVAVCYLMDLVDRSLIIVSKRSSTGGVKAFLMHDLIREFCLERAEEEHLFKVIEGGSSDDLVTSPSSCSTMYEQRRLFMRITRDKKFLSKSSSGTCSVRSLVFFTPIERLFPPSDINLSRSEFASIILGFRHVRVLNLLGFLLGRSFPVEIVSLVQLKYLAILGMYLVVPSSVSNLRKLETFIVGGDIAYVSAISVLKMTKLRHLCIPHLNLTEVSSLDESFRLDSLQTLSSQVLIYGDDKEIMRRFPNLRKLKCWFKESSGHWRNCSWLPRFQNKLESLNIVYPNGVDMIRCSSEFNLPLTVKKLSLKYTQLRWEQVSAMGKLPNLQVLKLLNDAFVDEELNMKDGEFPKLRFLKLRSLNIRRWVASEDYFPPIEQLIVSFCYKLEEMPSCLEEIPTLKAIKIRCYNDSLKAAANQIEEEQRDTGNELKVEITDMRSRGHSR